MNIFLTFELHLFVCPIIQSGEGSDMKLVRAFINSGLCTNFCASAFLVKIPFLFSILLIVFLSSFMRALDELVPLFSHVSSTPSFILFMKSSAVSDSRFFVGWLNTTFSTSGSNKKRRPRLELIYKPFLRCPTHFSSVLRPPV